MSSNRDNGLNESGQSPLFESPGGAYFGGPSLSPSALQPTFFASDRHLHGSFQEGVANYLDMSDVENLSKTKEVVDCFESGRAADVSVHDEVRDLALDRVPEQNRDGEPVESNEVTSVEDRTEESSKRPRGPNWMLEENAALLVLMEEAKKKLRKGKQVWNYISEGLQVRYNFVRTSKNCEDRWGTLLKLSNAIRKQKRGHSDGEMDKDESSDEKLPSTLPVDWFEIVKRIHAEKNLKRPRSADHGGNQTSDRKDSGTKESGATLQENISRLLKKLGPFIKQKVGDMVDSEVEGLRKFMMTSNVTSEQEAILTSMIPQVKHQVGDAAISLLKTSIYTGKFVGDEQDLITMLDSDEGIGISLKDALIYALRPVALALHTTAEKEQEDQAKLQAIEEEIRALNLKAKDIKSKRRRGGRRDQRAQKTSKRLVPKSKGLRIAGDQCGVSFVEDE